MNLSIRMKLFVYITVIILLFAALLYAFNTFFAEKYYISYKKNHLIKSSKKVEELIAGRHNGVDFKDHALVHEISTLEKSIGGTILISNTSEELFYPASNNRSIRESPNFITSPPLPAPSSLRQPRIPRWKSWFMFLTQSKRSMKNVEQYDANSFFIIAKDTNFQIDTLRYQTKLDNGVLILIWVPMTGISENAAISSSFTAVVGLITIFITGIWALYISNRFTRPIAEINRITKKMADLDFSQFIRIDRKDEIGELSQSINNLSYSLNDAINELNSRNRQLEQDIEREQKLDKMRREFVSNVSHELKTPIFLIQGYADGLKSNVASDEEKRNFYCDVIMEETEKMDKLVKDLLNLSYIESGIFRIDKIDFSLDLLLEDIITKYAPVIKEKEIRLEADMEESIEVYADRSRIEQVISNLMNNAIDHVEASKEIRLSVKSAEDKIRVSVFNTGQPIPIEALDKIWSSFYKIDQSRARDLGGTGLGLSIVRAIQEAHGDGYGVSNTEGGVEFWFEISTKSS